MKKFPAFVQVSASGPKSDSPSWAVLRLLGLTAINGTLLAVLTPFAFLKEDPMFWRNAGGWPVWLRELVLTTFYPLLFSEFFALVALSALCLRHPVFARARRQLWPIAGTMWLWTGAVVLVVLGNNVSNLLEGRSLHWHAKPTTLATAPR
jgi:hypothetical protein